MIAMFKEVAQDYSMCVTTCTVIHWREELHRC
jgi:hypothetical protein